jgi:nitronate monooxygenase
MRAELLVPVMIGGETGAGAWSRGMAAGLIHDIPTCRELVDRIMARVDEIISVPGGRC